MKLETSVRIVYRLCKAAYRFNPTPGWTSIRSNDGRIENEIKIRTPGMEIEILIP